VILQFGHAGAILSIQRTFAVQQRGRFVASPELLRNPAAATQPAATLYQAAGQYAKDQD